ncbi:transcription termination factor Rho [Streptomyces sp. T-3]|nr:transcription termination factor Rho [Streptomyces sp. T-3]
MTTTLEPPITQSDRNTTRTATRAKEKPTAPAVGVLDIGSNGNGHLRTHTYLPASADIQVPAALIRRHGLRKGDIVEGLCARSRTLTEVEQVNGLAPELLQGRRKFAALTPLHPRDRLRLEHPAGGLAPRMVDLIAPIGKGQRGLIVAPPKTGKTVLLQQLAAAITTNHPEAHLMVLLVDERPEEVTDMRRAIKGEVLASTFDKPARQHIALAELAIERAKRLVEQGQDVIILLDSLTRLCRAYNNAASSGGKTLSGGVDASAVQGPKQLFGAARLAEEGGSLTILATALVETGSRADDYFFEELKGTGNMELRLDRSLADKRMYPAFDLNPSGTRREELLLPKEELTAVRGLRRVLHNRDAQTAYEAVRDQLRKTPDNAAFVRQLHQTVPGA